MISLIWLNVGGENKAYKILFATLQGHVWPMQPFFVSWMVLRLLIGELVVYMPYSAKSWQNFWRLMGLLFLKVD